MASRRASTAQVLPHLVGKGSDAPARHRYPSTVSPCPRNGATPCGAGECSAQMTITSAQSAVAAVVACVPRRLGVHKPPLHRGGRVLAYLSRLRLLASYDQHAADTGPIHRPRHALQRAAVRGAAAHLAEGLVHQQGEARPEAPAACWLQSPLWQW